MSGFSATRGQLPGAATNDNAAAGNVGEYIEAVLSSGSPTSLTSGTPKTIVSLTLTPGDWDVSGTAGYLAATNTSVTRYATSISLADNTPGADGTGNINVFAAFVDLIGFAKAYPTPVVRVSVAVTTTVYLVGVSDFTVGTLTAFGRIRARRAR